MNKKNIYYGVGGLLVGLIIMYFAKDYIEEFLGKSFSPAPAKAK